MMNLHFLEKELADLEHRINQTFWSKHGEVILRWMVRICMVGVQGSLSVLIYESYVDEGIIIAMITTVIATMIMYWIYIMIYEIVENGECNE